MRLAYLLILALAAFAQQPAERSRHGAGSLRTGRPAEMEAWVVDDAGRAAADLTAADFSLEPGNAGKIESCTYVDTRARRTMVFVVDDLSLSAEAIGGVRAALGQFMETALQPDDRVAILRSGSGAGDLEQLTGDREKLRRAIARLYYNPREALYTSATARANAFNTGALGTLRGALAGLDGLPGRKSVVLLSASLTQPVSDLVTLVLDAKQAGASVYGIDPSAASAPVASAHISQADAAETGMSAMARGTGGKILSAGTALAGMLAEAMSGLNGYYRIHYQESVASNVPRLAVAPSGLRLLSTRQVSESAGDTPLAVAPQRQDDLPHAMSDPFSTGQVRMRLDPLFYNSAQGSGVWTLVDIDVRDLTFRQGIDGTYRGGVRVLVASFSSTGLSLHNGERTFDLAWTRSQYQEHLRTGLVVGLNLPAPGGMRQIRAIVSDGASGRMGSANQWLEIPTVEDGRLAISGIRITLSGPQDSSMGDRSQEKGADDLSGARIFRGGQPIDYHCELYNVTAEGGNPVEMELKIMLFREGRMVASTPPASFTPTPGTDPHRWPAEGRINLPPILQPGSYTMRFTVSDKPAAGQPARTATQFVDFEFEQAGQ
jgi:VWFA-related protein